MKFCRRKNIILAAALAVLIAVTGTSLSGCGMAVRSASTSLSIDETGKLREEIVEPQGQDDFTAEELEGYIEQEIELYNRSREGAVKLNSCTVLNGEVKISLEYASFDDYAAFNQVTCFAGTLQEAEDAGYEVERTWLEPGGTKGDMEIIRERFREWKVFIVSEEINVKVPDKILYASENVKITGRLTAVVQSVMNEENEETAIHPLATVADRFAYIIYK